MNWGKGIVLAFVGFAAFIITLVTICMRQDVNLVSRDYYQEELEYQKQIDRINNTSALTLLPSIKIVNDSLILEYDNLPLTTDAVLKLMRPSSAMFDVAFDVPATSATKAMYSLGNMPTGRYKSFFVWTMNGKQYYVETPVDL